MNCECAIMYRRCSGIFAGCLELVLERLSLELLLKGVNDQNLPGEWDTGPNIGKEL